MFRRTTVLLTTLVVWATPTTVLADSEILCPPLPIETDHRCECKVANYNDDPVEVTLWRLYAETGFVVSNCDATIIPAKASTFCSHVFTTDNDCGCEVAVRKKSKKVRVSLSATEDATDVQAQAAVSCSGK